jgi:hypothetical protein
VREGNIIEHLELALNPPYVLTINAEDNSARECMVVSMNLRIFLKISVSGQYSPINNRDLREELLLGLFMHFKYIRCKQDWSRQQILASHWMEEVAI